MDRDFRISLSLSLISIQNLRYWLYFLCNKETFLYYCSTQSYKKSNRTVQAKKNWLLNMETNFSWRSRVLKWVFLALLFTKVIVDNSEGSNSLISKARISNTIALRVRGHILLWITLLAFKQRILCYFDWVGTRRRRKVKTRGPRKELVLKLNVHV